MLIRGARIVVMTAVIVLLGVATSGVLAQDEQAIMPVGSVMTELDCDPADPSVVTQVTGSYVPGLDRDGSAPANAREALEQFVDLTEAPVSSYSFNELADDGRTTQFVLERDGRLLASAFVEEVATTEVVTLIAGCESTLHEGSP